MGSKRGAIARRRLVRRIAAPLAAAGIIVLCVAQVSAAPGPSAPSAETGAATDVTVSTATLHGTINPHGAATTYYFQYGRTTPFTQRTPVQSAGAGTQNIAVSAPVSDLSWGREYQFRLVAKNAEGTATGAINEFRTQEPRLVGRYVVQLRVTSGGDAFGEHRGMRVSRTYRLHPRNCGAAVCGAVRLNRQGKRGKFRDLLKHRSRGVFVGTDRFRGWCDDGLRFRSRARTRLEVRGVSAGRATALGGRLRVRAHGCVHGGEKASLKGTAQ